ncbi:MAG: archaemetzincin family Zn-dependent metalloprotease [Bacteroidota bacterium]
MNPVTITLLSFGHPGKRFTDIISEAVINEFKCDVQIREAHIDLSEFYDANRRQYNGDRLLKVVDNLSIPGSDKIIGLFHVDLFIPILTFIYGQAQLGGRSAIASFYRLSNERYGMTPDEHVLQDRLIKEVIHELGHTFGLIHCTDPACVMRSSTYVEDIDQKEVHLCIKCRAQLGMN